MKRLLWLLSILLLVPGVSSCGCPAILKTRLEPSTVTLTVGETAAPPRALVQECFDPWREVEVEEWVSEEPDIASVDPDTGTITGIAPGETRIIATADEPVPFGGDVSVTVVLPATAAR
jgi:hypothetical protein